MMYGSTYGQRWLLSHYKNWKCFKHIPLSHPSRLTVLFSLQLTENGDQSQKTHKKSNREKDKNKWVKFIFRLCISLLIKWIGSYRIVVVVQVASWHGGLIPWVHCLKIFNSIIQFWNCNNIFWNWIQIIFKQYKVDWILLLLPCLTV